MPKCPVQQKVSQTVQQEVSAGLAEEEPNDNTWGLKGRGLQQLKQPCCKDCAGLVLTKCVQCTWECVNLWLGHFLMKTRHVFLRHVG